MYLCLVPSVESERKWDFGCFCDKITQDSQEDDGILAGSSKWDILGTVQVLTGSSVEAQYKAAEHSFSTFA